MSRAGLLIIWNVEKLEMLRKGLKKLKTILIQPINENYDFAFYTVKYHSLDYKIVEIQRLEFVSA